MNIVILGAGTKGSYLAKILAKEQHDIFLIDKDSNQLKKIGEEADIATIPGHAANWKLLDKLLENQPSLFIALTGDDEANLVACTIAKNLGYPQTIARIKDLGFLSSSRLDFGRLFFVDHFLGVESITAHDLLKNIMNPEDLAIENFAHGSIQMRTIIIPSLWGKFDIPLSKLNLPDELVISLIRRKTDDGEEIIFPTGYDYIKPLDEITVVGETKIMYDLHSIFMSPEKEITSVVIAGGSAVALSLAKILARIKIKTKIIEKNFTRCKELAEALPKTMIINKDATDIIFLEGAEIKNADIFIACTSDDRINVLISLIAKQLGCKKILSLISDISLSPILRELEIHYTMSEKVNIANKVLSIIHAKKVISMSSLCENQATILEIKVSPDSTFVGIPLSDLKGRLPPKVIIAAIENKGSVMIGKGDRIVSPNDTLIIICSPEHVNELQELF